MENVNIFRSKLVPEHIKLSEEDKIKILKQFNLSTSQIPKIYSSDPALAGMEIKTGDLIKIIRDSVTNNKSVFYRVVVNG